VGSGKRQAPLSVLIIVEDLPVPFDRRAWQEACALRDAGYRVSVICPKRNQFTRSRETLEGIEIYRHRLREASGLLGYLLEYPWALAAEWLLALRVYLRTRFRVIHACNPPDIIFLVAAFFKLFGVRFIFDHHDLNPELYEVKFGRRRGILYRLVCLAERLTFRTADVSIASNASFREIALQRGRMSPERVFVVYSTPDLSRVRRGPARPELKQGWQHLVVYLGTMGPQEGVDLLVKAAGLIKARRADTGFVLIGWGSEAPRLQALATSQGLDGMLRFTGRIPDAQLSEYLSTADVCVAPDPNNAMNDKSTMNKILQYMAYGRPVVLFDLTEGRRAAGEAALYASPNDAGDFAEKIMALLDSESLRRELGEQGRRRVEGSLNWEREKQELLAAYRTALGGDKAKG